MSRSTSQTRSTNQTRSAARAVSRLAICAMAAAGATGANAARIPASISETPSKLLKICLPSYFVDLIQPVRGLPLWLPELPIDECDSDSFASLCPPSPYEDICIYAELEPVDSLDDGILQLSSQQLQSMRMMSKELMVLDAEGKLPKSWLSEAIEKIAPSVNDVWEQYEDACRSVGLDTVTCTYVALQALSSAAA